MQMDANGEGSIKQFSMCEVFMFDRVSCWRTIETGIWF
jgi:hypothetical protein